MNSPDRAGALANKLVSIVVPVFNEARTIATVIDRLDRLPFEKQIIVVDDGSTDGTRDQLFAMRGHPALEVLLKHRNEGKGAALRSGFRAARGDYVVVQDADLEYDPANLPRVLLPLACDEADVVFGSRFIGPDSPRSRRVHRWGNGLLTAASNAFNGVKLTDMETGYKAFRRTALDGIEIEQNRFGVEPELTAKLARRGFRFAEVPISYHARSYAQGKKIGLKDLFQAIYCIVRYGVCD